MQRAYEIDVDKQIKHLEDPDLGKKFEMNEFVNACRKEWKSEHFEKKSIVIKKPDNLILPKLEERDKKQLRLNGLSFDISAEDATKIINQIFTIVTDPLCVASLLKELDTELEEVMQRNKIQFTDDDLPRFLMTGKGSYVPGPPPENYHPKKKEMLLDTLLLAREQKNGINKEGSAPKFVGFVDPEKANPLVISGHIFTEDKQISRILLHGSFTHRLMFDTLCCAIKTGKLNLQFGNGKELNPQQLLEMLVHTNYYKNYVDFILEQNPISLWTLTIDASSDTTTSNKDFLNPDHYGFSCRSPFVLNSLLICFGKEVGLPNLQHYLLDSHWKAAYEMVYRVKNSMTSQDIPDSRIYTYCMEALSTTEGKAGMVDIRLPFTLDESDAKLDPTYEPFESTSPSNIVKKLKSPGSTREYASWSEFYDRQKQKQSAFFQSSPTINKTKLESSGSLKKDNQDQSSVNFSISENFMAKV